VVGPRAGGAGARPAGATGGGAGKLGVVVAVGAAVARGVGLAPGEAAAPGETDEAGERGVAGGIRRGGLTWVILTSAVGTLVITTASPGRSVLIWLG
jgi:hypothetical protein